MPKGTDRLARSLTSHALVQVVVPSADRSRRPVPSQRFRRLIEEIFLEVATGTITLQGEGTWMNRGAQPVRERILLVESFLPARMSSVGSRRIARRLSEIAQLADQEALFVAVNGRPFLLPGIAGNAKGGG